MRMLRWLLVLSIGLMPSIKSPQAQCAGDCPGNWGTELNSFRNIVAYSNGSDVDCCDGTSDYGYRYQCVEFVKRFYGDEVGDPIVTSWGDAKNAFGLADGGVGDNNNLVRFAQGNEAKPQPGDILCFGPAPGHSNVGHVGIVMEIGDDYLLMIDQNRTTDANNDPCRLSLSSEAPYMVGTFGSGYEVQGWLRDPDYKFYACSYGSQMPSGVAAIPSDQPIQFTVKFVNNGRTPWFNDPEAHHNDYVELKACDSEGNVLSDGSSPLHYHSWINLESPCTMQEAVVDPGDTATFVFVGQVSGQNDTGVVSAYFRPNHSSGGLLRDWGGMHFQLDIRTGTWFSTTPMGDCVGPSDDSSHNWYQPDFVVTPGQWAPVLLPNTGWGCDYCDRFYRLTYSYGGSESGDGVSIHFKSDDAISVWINGIQIGAWGTGCHQAGCVNGDPPCNPNYSVPDIDITSYLHTGQENVIAAHVSDWTSLENFDMQLMNHPLSITGDAICCLGSSDCREITEDYPSTTCLADGGTVYVGDWFDCGTFSSCDSPQKKGKADPTLFFQTSVPLPTAPAQINFSLIDTLPRSAWYDLPDILGGYRLYVSGFTGAFTAEASVSSNPDTLNIVLSDYSFDCPSVELGSIETGPNHISLDTSVSATNFGSYSISTGMVDLTVQTLIINDLYPESSPIRGRSQIRGHLDNSTGVLAVGSESYNVLPGAILVPGDVNADGVSDVSDLVYLVDYQFNGGPGPIPITEAADVNCDGGVDVSDLIYMVTYMFGDGPSPCDHL